MRIGIANDQRLATEALRRIVLSDPQLQVAWTAVDGRDAVHKCRQDPPDVILMDLVMPEMNGAEATREIMRSAPCPVLVVTATISGNYALVCEALGHGAYDAICLPVLGDRPPGEAGAPLLAKLRAVERIRQEGSAAPRRVETASASVPRPVAAPSRCAARPLVAIGSSTGGPQALERILSAWPASFPAAVVVVQHIAQEFAGSLALWLQQRCSLVVRTAQAGDSPEPGSVLIAATNDHLALDAERRLVYRREPASTPYRPSVDVLFHSLAQHWPVASVAVLLTGIGRDGADGLLKLRQSGWHTIAQDQASCVVYGMPQAAAELGAARRILSLDEIAPHVASHLARLAPPPTNTRG